LILINTGLMLRLAAVLLFGYRHSYHGTNRGPLLGTALASVGLNWRSARLRMLFAAPFTLFIGWLMALTYVPVAVTVLYDGPDQGRAVGLVVGAAGLAALVLGPLVGALN
jgi:hypothetical protein